MNGPVSYPAVVGRLSAAREDRLAGLLERTPALGSQVEDLEPGWIRFTVYFPTEERETASGFVALLEALGAENVKCGAMEELDWLEAYRRRARPFPVGRTWWIDPHPARPTPAPPGRSRLCLEPRSAFGSGSHETTQLVLLALEERDLAGRSVLDVGTGSGVLAIAALRRGAALAAGLDVDPEAVAVARETCALQDPPAPVRLFWGELAAAAPGAFDLVLANIVSGILLPLLPGIRRVLAPGGEAVLSGLLAGERARALGEVAAAGLEPVRERVMGEWLALELRRA